MNKISPSANIALHDNTHIAKSVLMPGDPLRAKYIAEHYLENPVLFNDVRNMLGYTGTYKGKEVSVMGSGMGMPSFTLYANELYDYFDVDTILRVGSTGAIQESVKMRDLVIAMSASTDSNMPMSYGLPGFIAPTASFDLLEKAVEVGKEMKVGMHVGAVYTSDYFYHPDPNINKVAASTNHLCLEMETAALYLAAMVRKKRALSLLTVSDHLITGEALDPKEREQGFTDMMVVALETVTR